MYKFFKIIRFVIGFLCVSGGTNLTAQNWESLGNGTDILASKLYTDSVTNRLYAIGFFTYADDTVLVNGITYWDGTKWNDLDSGNTECPTCNPISNIISFQGNVYVTGQFTSFHNVPNTKFMIRFNGVNWESIGNTNGMLTFHHYNNQLLATGFFDTINGVYAENFALYDGMNWSSFNIPSFLGVGDFVSTIAEYNGELYVGGNFDLPNGLEEIAKFDGSQWVSVGGGIKGNAWVTKMLVYKNELYVAGQFHKSVGNAGNGIMKWNGTNWSDLNLGLTFGIGAQIKDMVIYNDELIVVGFMLTADGFPVQNIAKWDGTKWCNFRNNFNGTAEAVEVFNGELVVSCRDSMDLEPVKYMAKWIGGNQSDSCGTVGIEDKIDESNAFNIYPNPTNNNITIKLQEEFYNKDISIEIYDIIGQLSYSNIFKKHENNNLTINVSHFPKGIYLVKLQMEGENYSTKFVKQ